MPVAGAADPRLHEAARALEALLIKQIVTASGAYRGGDAAGSGIRADLFADALADAVARSGGIGLAAQIERSLGASPPGPALLPPPVSPSPGFPRQLTSPFGLRADPFTGEPAFHEGVDLGASEGTPVLAAAAGVVRSAGPRPGYGNTVEIDHGGGLTTLYAHASHVLVHQGDEVGPGQPVARVGHTGRSTGPHLHFEVRLSGRPLDPARAIKAYALRADRVIGTSP